MRAKHSVSGLVAALLALALAIPVTAQSSDLDASRAVAGQVTSQGSVARISTPGIESPADIFDRGMRAFNAKDYAASLSDLERAASFGEFRAQFNLARIYAQGLTGYVDHARAYQHYRLIADRYAAIDPYHNPLVAHVAYAHLAVGLYLRGGVPALNLPTDRIGALTYLERAASYFGHEDAQFELAKTLLSDPADGRSISTGLHHLSKLAYGSGSPAAQAVLGDLYWNGQFVEQRPQMGLALLALAASNAPEHERLWVEDLYQKMYCQTPMQQRGEAFELAFRFSQQLQEESAPAHQDLVSNSFRARTQMTCRNGETVAIKSFPRRRSGDFAPGQPRRNPVSALEANAQPASSRASTGATAIGSVNQDNGVRNGSQSGSMMSLGGALPR